MEWKIGVINGLDKLIEYQKHLNLSITQLKELYALRNDIEDPFTLLVAGEFKSGKSSFINAILGEDILTSDVNPATAILTKIKYGKEKRIIAHFKNGSIEPFPIDWLDKLTSENDDIARRLRASITMVEVEVPNEILNLVTLIDSPGLQAGIKHHNQMTESFLTRPDYVLWVFDYFQVGKATEIKVLKKFKEIGIPVAGIINKIDLHDPAEQSFDDYYDFVNRRLHGLVTNLQCISAKNALKGKLTGSEELLKSSQLEEVEKFINSIIKNFFQKARRTYERLSSITQVVYKQLIEKKPDIPGYNDFLFPFHKKDYPTIKQLQQQRDERLQYLTDCQNELKIYAIQSKKSINDLFSSFENIHSIFEKVGVDSSRFSVSLEYIVYLSHQSDQLLTKILNNISSYNQKKIKLEQLSQTLKENWEYIKDAKFFKKKKTKAFQLALIDFLEKYDVAKSLYNEVLSNNHILQNDVREIKNYSVSLINELLNYIQEQKQIVCNKWNDELRKYRNKYHDFTPDKIKTILHWFQVVEAIYSGLSMMVQQKESIISDIDSYKEFNEERQKINRLVDEIQLIMPILEEFEQFYNLESVLAEIPPKINFELDIESITFVDIQPLEKQPSYSPRQVLQRIELNRKRFIVLSLTTIIILIIAKGCFFTR